MSKNVFSGKFDPTDETTLREKLEKENFIIAGVQHAFWQARRDRVFITFYRSGKVLIQGKNATDYAEQYLLPLKEKQDIHGLEFIKSLKEWIGTDESGKGDFFGPLVVGALFVNKKIEQKLWTMGVRDSKSISDQKILEFAHEIKKVIPFSVVTYTPDKYNKIYSEINNLNRLLAAAHAHVITNLIEKTNCNVVIADKFGDETLIQNALGDTKNLKLIQKNRAEQNLAVAGASILARENFIRGLENQSKKYQMNFPTGASGTVVEAANLFVQRFGKKELKNVAKVHFKTVKQL